MRIWTKINRWRERMVGAPRSGFPAAGWGALCGLSSLGLIALVALAPAAVIAADGEAPISTAYCIDCVPFQIRNQNGAPAGFHLPSCGTN